MHLAYCGLKKVFHERVEKIKKKNLGEGLSFKGELFSWKRKGKNREGKWGKFGMGAGTLEEGVYPCT